MAQHIPISELTQKVFKNIEQSIKKDFLNPYIKGSLKYEFLERIVGKQNIADYKINENDDVYTANRRIGKGFVFGTDRGDFEIHFNTKTKQVINIFLVA